MSETTEAMERRREEARSDRDEPRELRGDTVELPRGTATATHGTPASEKTTPAGDGHGPLFPEDESRRLRSRWEEIQASFVDEPRTSVAEADELVRETTETLHEVFEGGRRQLEGAWDRGDEVPTEDLRMALKRYRSFFERLLTI